MIISNCIFTCTHNFFFYIIANVGHTCVKQEALQTMLANNSQEVWLALSTSGVGIQSPTWTKLVNLYPRQLHELIYSGVDGGR